MLNLWPSVQSNKLHLSRWSYWAADWSNKVRDVLADERPLPPEGSCYDCDVPLLNPSVGSLVLFIAAFPDSLRAPSLSGRSHPYQDSHFSADPSWSCSHIHIRPRSSHCPPLCSRLWNSLVFFFTSSIYIQAVGWTLRGICFLFLLDLLFFCVLTAAS